MEPKGSEGLPTAVLPGEEVLQSVQTATVIEFSMGEEDMVVISGTPESLGRLAASIGHAAASWNPGEDGGGCASLRAFNAVGAVADIVVVATPTPAERCAAATVTVLNRRRTDAITEKVWGALRRAAPDVMVEIGKALGLPLGDLLKLGDDESESED